MCDHRVMFTGIIQAKGQLQRSEHRDGDQRLWIDSAGLNLSGVSLGDSIAVNGVCLTAVELGERGFAADVSNETLGLTTLGQLSPGDTLNLELALTLNQPLGGHLVSGHVDGIGKVTALRDESRSLRMDFEAPGELARYIARKGSITVNGVSLTVNAVEGCGFGVNLVPHTLQETNLGELEVGSPVNLEVDLLARYLERLLTGAQDSQTSRDAPLLLASLHDNMGISA